MKIYLAQDNLKYGLILGCKISRCEFLWGNKLVDQQISDDAVNEIVALIPADVNVDKTSFGSFRSGIIDYFYNNDREKLYSILIGMCCYMLNMSGSTKNFNNMIECLTLAKSYLKDIPKDIIEDTEKLFETLYDYKSDLNQLIEYVLGCSA
ncbi:MAG: hypothetical protein ACI4M5_00205 [Christensenellales bacterium]